MSIVTKRPTCKLLFQLAKQKKNYTAPLPSHNCSHLDFVLGHDTEDDGDHGQYFYRGSTDPSPTPPTHTPTTASCWAMTLKMRVIMGNTSTEDAVTPHPPHPPTHLEFVLGHDIEDDGDHGQYFYRGHTDPSPTHPPRVRAGP